MKKQKLILLLFLPLFILTSCVKQKNCEEGIIGNFRYLEEPKYIKPNCQFKGEKIVANFTIGNISETNCLEYFITGSIPKKYQTGDMIKVRVLLHDIHEKDIKHLTVVCPAVYKLKCIEKTN